MNNNLALPELRIYFSFLQPPNLIKDKLAGEEQPGAAGRTVLLKVYWTSGGRWVALRRQTAFENLETSQRRNLEVKK